MRNLRTAVIALTFILAGTLSFAQQGARPGPMRGPLDNNAGDVNPSVRSRPSDTRREEHRKKMEAARLGRLSAALKLDAAASAKMSSILSAGDLKRQGIIQEQEETMRALRASLSAQKQDEALIKPLLTKLEKNRRSMQELKDKEFTSLKAIFTIEQQARYLLFQQQFMREMPGMNPGARGSGPGQWRRDGERGKGGPGRPRDDMHLQ